MILTCHSLNKKGEDVFEKLGSRWDVYFQILLIVCRLRRSVSERTKMRWKMKGEGPKSLLEDDEGGVASGDPEGEEGGVDGRSETGRGMNVHVGSCGDMNGWLRMCCWHAGRTRPGLRRISSSSSNSSRKLAKR